MRKFLCALMIFLSGVLLYQLGYIRTCTNSYKGLQCKTHKENVAEAQEARSSSSSAPISSSSSSRVSGQIKAFDIDVLARAVAGHETCGCTCGIVLPEPNPDGVNNCFGIKDKSTGRPKNYATQEEAYADFKALWKSKYGGFPTLDTASKYVGHDGSAWLEDVTRRYNRYSL